MNEEIRRRPGRPRGAGYSPISSVLTIRGAERMIAPREKRFRGFAIALTRALEELFPDRGPREALLIKDIARFEVLLILLGETIGREGIPALPNKRGEYLADYCRLANLKRQAIVALGPAAGKRIGEALAPYEMEAGGEGGEAE